MFSYSVKVRKINKSGLKLKAVATLIVDDIMHIEGFKIIEGSKGLFVTPPSHKGKIMEDGVEVEKYFDDIRFVGDQGTELSREIKETILREYNNSSSSTARVASAQAQAKAQSKVSEGDSESNQASSKPKASSAPDRARKPLWGFS